MTSRRVLKILPLGCLFALALISATGSEKADTTKTFPPPIVWKLDTLASVGGLKPEILGSPAVVEEDGVKAIVFDGKTDGLFLSTHPIAGWSRFTIEVLIKPDPTGGEEQRFIHIQDAQGRRAMVETRLTRDGQWVLDTYLRASAEHGKTLIDRAKKHPAGQWHWVALVYDGEVMTNYINGIKELEGEILLPPMVDGAMSIGVRQNKVSWYKGAIREVRFTRAALGAEALQRVTPVR